MKSVHRQRVERHGLLVDDLEAIVPDVRNAGSRVLAHCDPWRDIRTAVIRAIVRYWQGPEIDGVAGDDVFIHRRVLYDDRRDALRQSGEDALDDGFLGGLQRDQRLCARVVDPGYERKGRTVPLENKGRAGRQGDREYTLGPCS